MNKQPLPKLYTDTIFVETTTLKHYALSVAEGKTSLTDFKTQFNKLFTQIATDPNKLYLRENHNFTVDMYSLLKYVNNLPTNPKVNTDTRKFDTKIDRNEDIQEL